MVLPSTTEARVQPTNIWHSEGNRQYGMTRSAILSPREKIANPSIVSLPAAQSEETSPGTDAI